jgi:glycosyltransferase involved in cell wall biosynthesis
MILLGMVMSMVENNVKKRILVIVPIYYPHFGGAEKAIFELYKRVSRVYDIDLLCPNFGSDKLFENNGFFNIYRVCNESNSRVLKTFKYQYNFIKKALELSKQNKYHLIHTHYIFPTGLAGVYLKNKLKIPLVITEHHFGTGMDISSENENPVVINPIMRWIVSKSDRMVSTGETQNHFLEFLGCNNYKTIELGGDCEVSNLSNNDCFKKLNLDDSKKYLLNVSRLEKRKKTEDLILAIEKISKVRSDIILLIGGKGPETEKLKKIIIDKNLEKNVKLLGFISDEDLSMYRKISTAFVTTSNFEGAGIMYFEAFCSNLSLFARKNVASCDVVEDTSNGFLFDSFEELGDLILKYVDDSVKLNSVGSEGFKLYQNRYNWSEHSKKYLEVYNFLL